MNAHVERARARGYILLEAMVTGAIVAVMLMSVINLLGAARDDEVRAARRAIASDLALGRLAQLQGRGYAELSAGTTTTSVSPPGGGQYQVRTVLTAGSDSVAVAAPTGTTVTVQYLEANIEVTFGTPPRGANVQGRIYQARLE
jgi:Tfp pilus assembly protein FimT